MEPDNPARNECRCVHYGVPRLTFYDTRRLLVNADFRSTQPRRLHRQKYPQL